MLDANRDVAALVYDADQDPDAILRDFALQMNAQGLRAVGMVQAGQCADSSLSAVLLPSGETVLLSQDFDPAARGCRLDLSRLHNAGARVAEALDAGADLLIINRFGKREQNGQGLAYLIARACDAGIPVVIAVSSERLTEWDTFSGGTTVKLACDRQSLDGWWRDISTAITPAPSQALPR